MRRDLPAWIVCVSVYRKAKRAFCNLHFNLIAVLIPKQRRNVYRVYLLLIAIFLFEKKVKEF